MDIILSENPKVSLLLLSYNQEQFIEEALLSVLDIEYENIEVIISDDASTDKTFSVIERVIGKYEGNKKVTVLKNDINLGIGKHVNKLLKLVSGELIFFAAGDDVSYKHRVSVVVDTWLQNDRKPDAICSSADLIDENGEIIGLVQANQIKNDLCDDFKYFFGDFIGCSEVITARMVSTFGGIDESIIGNDKIFSEDRVFAFRGFLLGGVMCIRETLVGYRVSRSSVSNNISLTKICSYEERKAYRKLELSLLSSVLSQYICDIKLLLVKKIIDGPLCSTVLNHIKLRQNILTYQMKIMEGGVLLRLLMAFKLVKYFKYGKLRVLKLMLAVVYPRKYMSLFP